MNKIGVIVIFLSLLSGCKFDEPVVFNQIDEVKIDSIKDGIVNLSAKAIFTNPNEIEGKLNEVNIVVSLDDKVLATISQTEQLKIEKKSSFEIPIQIQFALEDVQDGLLKNLMNILSGNKIKLHFDGEIKVGTFIFIQTVEVDYYEEVKLQL